MSDPYPVRAMWNALIASIVFQHESLESLLRELARNPSLLEACGFDPLPIQRKPKARVVTDPQTGVSRIEFPPAAEQVRAPPKARLSDAGGGMKRGGRSYDQGPLPLEQLRAPSPNLLARLKPALWRLEYDPGQRPITDQ